MGKFMDEIEVKFSKDFDTMKEMMTNIYDRLGNINNRLDVMEEAVTKSRLKDAKNALVKKLEHRREVKTEKKKLKKEKKKKIVKKDKAYKNLQVEFKKARKALGY